ITLRKQSFTNADKAWEESKKLINQDIPLILQVDLGYLPYFEEEGELHFGGHTITLAGYDEELGVAYVADSEFDGFQKIKIEQLKKGRNSEFGPKFMHPKNTQFSMKRRPHEKHPPLAAGVKVAIQKVVNNMLRSSANNNGIQGLKLFASSIPQWEEKLKGEAKNPKGENITRARLMFELLHGYIETWGTGGSLFRNLYREYLEGLLTHPELKEGPRAWNSAEFEILENSIPIIADSAKNWSLIAEILKNTADEYKEECLNHVDLSELHKLVLKILSKEEDLFKLLSKIKI
ncbi:MAG: DUF4872 domain-containing protein, partial [Promethearchaeota archaeon]